MNNKAKLGVWTPSARVICVSCHGPKFPNNTFDVESKEWKEVSGLFLYESSMEITKCDKCGEDIKLDLSTAVEHNLMLALQEQGISAEMWQTGGMNSACAVYKDNFDDNMNGESHFYLVTYDYDGDGYFCLGSFGKEWEWIEDEQVATPSFEEIISYILSLKNVKKGER